MTQANNAAELGDRWAQVVRSCCPNVTHADWELRQGELVITTRFDSRACGANGFRPRTVEVTVDAQVVEAYLRSSMLQRYYTNGRLIECVLSTQLGDPSRSNGSDHETPGTEQWSVSYADLGLPPESASPQQSGPELSG